MKFRKKPVVIEAVHYTEQRAKYGFRYDVFEANPWLYEAYENNVVTNCARLVTDGPPRVTTDQHLKIKTLEGDHRADPGDWIIRGVKGEIYPCKPDIFELTYEPVEDQPMSDSGTRV